MSNNSYFFTSESVGEGHPDKVADHISDAVLDALLEQDPMSRVACETAVTTGLVLLAGEITTKAVINYVDVVRQAIKDIGYTDPTIGFSYDSCGVMNALHEQSPDIAMGVDKKEDGEEGAGDQGLMFGYATNETAELMPLPILLSHKLTARLAELRHSGELPWLRPDCKSQVTVEYKDDKPYKVTAVVISTQHTADVPNDVIHKEIIEKVINPTIPAELYDEQSTLFHINPTGRFVIGGPHGDAGLTGRKIIVDTYGGMGRHGGGAFSGKDPSKVDRSACYMCRYIAKNIVAAGLADKCEVQLSYAIGVAEPTSVLVDGFGTLKVSQQKIEELVRENFELRPTGIINSLNLRRPIFRKTAAYGHFGRELPEFTWEKRDKAEALKKGAGL